MTSPSPHGPFNAWFASTRRACFPTPTCTGGDPETLTSTLANDIQTTQLRNFRLTCDCPPRIREIADWQDAAGLGHRRSPLAPVRDAGHPTPEPTHRTDHPHHVPPTSPSNICGPTHQPTNCLGVGPNTKFLPWPPFPTSYAFPRFGPSGHHTLRPPAFWSGFQQWPTTRHWPGPRATVKPHHRPSSPPRLSARPDRIHQPWKHSLGPTSPPRLPGDPTAPITLAILTAPVPYTRVPYPKQPTQEGNNRLPHAFLRRKPPCDFFAPLHTPPLSFDSPCSPSENPSPRAQPRQRRRKPFSLQPPPAEYSSQFELSYSLTFRPRTAHSFRSNALGRQCRHPPTRNRPAGNRNDRTKTTAPPTTRRKTPQSLDQQDDVPPPPPPARSPAICSPGQGQPKPSPGTNRTGSDFLRNPAAFTPPPPLFRPLDRPTPPPPTPLTTPTTHHNLPPEATGRRFVLGSDSFEEIIGSN